MYSVLEAEKEVEDMKAKFHTQYSELAKKIENIETTKSNEINVIIFGYEERLHKMEERLNATEAESRKIRDRAAADVVLYQKVCKSLYIGQFRSSELQRETYS
jgi:sugar-specific transcriptional regulator TrmB